jgi:hypothetical protein
VTKAEREMQRYLESFPSGNRAREYKRLLERRSPESAPEQAASPEPKPEASP